MTLRHAAALAAMTAAVVAGSPAGAGEFNGSVTYHWAYSPLSAINIDGQRAYSVGTTDGEAIFEGAEADLTNIAQHCLVTINPDGTMSGVCHKLDPTGDGWKESFSCGQPHPAPGEALSVCQGKAEVIPGSGTGRFAKMSGSSTLTLSTTGLLLDNVAVGHAVDVYQLRY